MNIDTIAQLLGWITIINIALLTLSTLAVVVLKDFMVTLHQGLFGLEKETLLNAYFYYLAVFKVLIIVFNLTPYIALKLIV